MPPEPGRHEPDNSVFDGVLSDVVFLDAELQGIEIFSFKVSTGRKPFIGSSTEGEPDLPPDLFHDLAQNEGDL
jgi:hypothetical protein